MSRPAAVDGDRIRSRLVDLIRIPSVTGEEDAAVARVADWLHETPAEVDHWHEGMARLLTDPAYPGHEVERGFLPVVAGILRGDRPGPTVMVTGHVDVVPPGDYDQWSVEPFSGLSRGDRIFGRGACDMKAGIVAALEVFQAFADGPRDFAGRVILVAVPAEEDSGLGTLAAIRRGWIPDVVIIPEPTAAGGPPRILVAHAGAMSLRIDVHGLAAHAAQRLAGESSLDHYVEIHRALRRDEEALNEAERDPLMRALGLPYATNIGRIQGGTWASSVMDQLEVEVRIGVALGESPAEAEARVRRAIAEGTSHVPWLARNPPTVTRLSGGFGAASTPAAHPLVQRLRGASAEFFGEPAAIAAAPYACDMAAWVRIAGRPTVLYGPGDLASAHATDEWVSLDQTIAVARALTRATEDLLELPRHALRSFDTRQPEGEVA